MNILVLGSGGREHVLAWKLRQSKSCNHLYVAPGNAGTADLATNLDVSLHDFEGIKQLVLHHQIELVVVGPEAPLVDGIRDFFEQDQQLQRIAIVGPDAKGAMLEGSKDFSKAFMQKYNIPTAAYRTFTKDQLAEGISYLDTCQLPIVLKADGLAAGKGVIIAQDLPTAKQTLTEMLRDAKFGDASSKVVIEEFLTGIELSVFVLSDGKNYLILPEAKDYKRIGEGDTGPNTGGMGAVSPVPFADAAFMTMVEERIVKPTLDGLQAEGIVYKGFIFVGLMNVNGEPFVIEYNARMGDPETQAVIPRIKNDFAQLMLATHEGRLNQISLQIDPQTHSTVVLVAGGYPDSYEKGHRIAGLANAQQALVFHAGTKLAANGDVLTNGGRVLALTGVGSDLSAALKNAYDAANTLCWEQIYYRKDIGKDLLNWQAEK
jgi:phosphoribosylamine---glycine ligase